MVEAKLRSDHASSIDAIVIQAVVQVTIVTMDKIEEHFVATSIAVQVEAAPLTHSFAVSTPRTAGPTWGLQ